MEPELDLEQSSEQDVQSPLRKKQSMHPSLKTMTSNDSKETITPDTSATITTATTTSSASMDKTQRNGHYELADTNRFMSQKRQAKVGKNHVGSSSHNEPWPKQHTHLSQYSMKQSSAGGTYEQHATKQNTRTHYKSISNRILSLKRENKTTQTLSIVVGGFIVCWLPFFVCYLITPFLPSKSISSTLSTILTWLGWFNSAMNPFIYAFYSVDFRAAFWRLTLRRFFKDSTKAPYSSNIMSIKR